VTSGKGDQQNRSDAKLEPGKHLPLRYNTFPKEDSNEPLPCTISGSNEESTTAYIFYYPFDIILEGQLSAIYDLEIDGRKVTIYPPFRSRPDTELAIENVPLTNVPRRPNTTSPDFVWGSAPTITFGREHSLRRTESLRVDCPKDSPYEFAANVADIVIGLIRWCTKQWWIKRGREHPRTHIRHWFHANELGERLAGVGTFRFFYGRMGFERPLDSQSWSAVADALNRGETIPLSWDIFLDAIYFHSIDDLRRSILEVAISNEVLLAEVLNGWMSQRRLVKAQVKRALYGNDYMEHLKRVGAFWMRSFEDECPNEFRWIKAAWIARGNVAHGKSPIAPLPEGISPMTLDDVLSVFASGIALREWLQSL
jgi:hypothetical protein